MKPDSDLSASNLELNTGVQCSDGLDVGLLTMVSHRAPGDLVPFLVSGAAFPSS